MKFVAQDDEAVRSEDDRQPEYADGRRYGMCGACRVTVGGKTRFTCVDGRSSNGHEVDFDEAVRRQGMYKTIESRKAKIEQERAEGHVCKVGLDR